MVDTQYIRTFDPKAWGLAVGVEILFALIIYTVTFRKVNKLNFREVA